MNQRRYDEWDISIKYTKTLPDRHAYIVHLNTLYLCDIIEWYHIKEEFTDGLLFQVSFPQAYTKDIALQLLNTVRCHQTPQPSERIHTTQKAEDRLSADIARSYSQQK